MIRAFPHPKNPALAIVLSDDVDELQAATGSPVRLEQDDPEWPWMAVVPAGLVAQLLESGPKL